MNCLIVDSNQEGRALLGRLASKISYLHMVAECQTVAEANAFMSSHAVDVLFLDVGDMPQTGLDLVRQLKDSNTIIVLTAAGEELAAEAFELNVADYMVKPVTPGRFLQAMEKVRGQYASIHSSSMESEPEALFIRENGVLRRVLLQDIDFIEAKGDYVKVFTGQTFHVILKTLRAMEERLPGDRFLRIHRSFIIAVGKVERIEDGAAIIKNKPIPVADTCRALLNKRLNII